METYSSSSRMDATGNYRFGHMPSASYLRADPFVAQKSPPYWGPELEATYPFKYWERDVGLWAASTDVEESKQGPLLAARLGGMARALAHTMPIQQLQYGAAVGGQQLTGIELLLRGLGRRFAPFVGETSARAMIEFLGFRRSQGESIDEAISRWELLDLRATDQAQFNMSAPGSALLLLVALGVPKQA